MSNQNLPALMDMPLPKRLEEVKKFIQSQLEENIDYGYIRDKKGNPISQKPMLFRSGAEKLALFFNLRSSYEVEEIEDWENGFFKYKVRCLLTNGHTGEVITEGLGLAHSKEKKFRSDKVDVYDLPNTLLKLAKKRAFVDAVLSATGGAYFFYSGAEDEEEMITSQQVKKLWATAKELGIPEEKVREILGKFNYQSSKAIKRKDYETIIGEIKNASKG